MKMSREEIMKAVNAGADLVTSNVSHTYSDDYENAANVIVCCIGAVLDDPDVTFEDAMRASFDDLDVWGNEFPQFSEEEERS